MAWLIAVLMSALLVCTAEAGKVKQKRHEDSPRRSEAKFKRAAGLIATNAHQREIQRQIRGQLNQIPSVLQPATVDIKIRTHDPCSRVILAVVADWNECDRGNKSGMFQAKTETDPSQRQTDDHK